MWDLTTGTLHAAFVAALIGNSDSVQAVACATVDSRPVAVTTSGDAMMRLWDLSGATGDTMPDVGHTDDIGAVACSTVDGRAVAVTVGRDTTVRVWDLATCTLRTTLTGQASWLASVACATVDGLPVAVVSDRDGTVRVWDLSTETVTAHHDETVRVFDLVTLAELAVFDTGGPVHRRLAVGPAQEIVIGTGRDVVVLARRPKTQT